MLWPGAVPEARCANWRDFGARAQARTNWRGRQWRRPGERLRGAPAAPWRQWLVTVSAARRHRR
jgi:hypothetical protein